MIYEYPNSEAPIRQGDIFLGIPKVEIQFASGLPTCSITEKMEKIPWEDIVKEGNITLALLPVIPVPAIVASQDCDARRSVDITLCEIKEFSKIENDFDKITKLEKKVNFITRQSCRNLKWFYLPTCEEIGFNKTMGVDFLSTINLPREDLEQMIDLRKARLKPVAYDHFRERIAHFYRRYAYNEWYPLNSNEMEIYSKNRAVDPSDWYDWQK